MRWLRRRGGFDICGVCVGGDYENFGLEKWPRPLRDGGQQQKNAVLPVVPVREFKILGMQ